MTARGDYLTRFAARIEGWKSIAAACGRSERWVRAQAARRDKLRLTVRRMGGVRWIFRDELSKWLRRYLKAADALGRAP